MLFSFLIQISVCNSKCVTLASWLIDTAVQRNVKVNNNLKNSVGKYIIQNEFN